MGGVLHVSRANKPTLEVCIEGMKLEYRLTEDDLKTLFSRFGDVEWVLLESRGTRAQITCMSVKQAEEAINGLDGRYLQPLQGTFRAVWSGSLGFQASCPTDEVENGTRRYMGTPLRPVALRRQTKQAKHT